MIVEDLSAVTTHDVLVIKRKPSLESADSPEPSPSTSNNSSRIPYKYTKALRKGGRLLQWEDHIGKSVENWPEAYLSKWKDKYFKFVDLLKDISLDFRSSKIDTDTYNALIHLKEEADRIWKRSSIPTRSLVEHGTPIVETKRGGWDEDEDTILKNMFHKGCSINEICLKLNLSEKSVCYRISKYFPSFVNPYKDAITAPSEKKTSTKANANTIDVDTILKYIASMKMGNHNGEVAPHKPVLLLALQSLITEHPKMIRNGLVPISEELERQFRREWRKYVKTKSFSCDMALPFFHMNSEPFWTLVPKPDLIVSLHKAPSLVRLRAYYKGANLKTEFINAMSQDSSSEIIKKALIGLIKNNLPKKDAKQIKEEKAPLAENAPLAKKIKTSVDSTEAVERKIGKSKRQHEDSSFIFLVEDFDSINNAIEGFLRKKFLWSPRTSMLVETIDSYDDPTYGHVEYGNINFSNDCMPYITHFHSSKEGGNLYKLITFTRASYFEMKKCPFDFDSEIESLISTGKF